MHFHFWRKSPLISPEFYILILFGLIFILVQTNCSPAIEGRFAKMSDMEIYDGPYPENRYAPCNAISEYTPDTSMIELSPEKTIRVNFHVMTKSDGTGNFTKEEMPDYVKILLNQSNSMLKKNEKMHLPLDNEIPVLPTRYKYELFKDPKNPSDQGIYFHGDDDLYYYVKTGKNKNHYERKQFEKYGNFKGEVLNIFLMPHHPDSVISKTYNPTLTGISFPDHLKIAGTYHLSRDTSWRDGKPFIRGAWFCHGILNHEVGHTLGLRHSWVSNDGCPDTPAHPNCFAKNKNPPCDTEWSNNVMDYNTHQNSWTPCQIGTVHYNFSNKNSTQRKLLKPTWCELDTTKNIIIEGQVNFLGAKDLEGHILIKPGAELRISCRLSLPAKAKIVVYPGAKLILDKCQLENDCGEKWAGIEIMGNGSSKGKVILVGEPVLENMQFPLDRS